MENKMKVVVLVSLETKRTLKEDACVSHETFWVAHSARCEKFAKAPYCKILNEGTKKHDNGTAGSEIAAGTRSRGSYAGNKHDGDKSTGTQRTYRLLSLRRSKYEEKHEEWNVCGTEEETAYSSTKRKQVTEDWVTLCSDTNSPLSCHYTYSTCMKR
jgi:hypothetical protein